MNGPSIRGWRLWVGLALLAPQLVLFVVARFHPMRFYCWSPYDRQHAYRITAMVDGEPLTDQQIRQRYKWLAEGMNPRALYQITATIVHVETHYHTDNPATVRIDYTVNGNEREPWVWPK